MRLFRSPQPPPAVQPGTLKVKPQLDPPRIRTLTYDQRELQEEEIGDPAQLEDAVKPGRVTWIDVQGLGNRDVLKEIAKVFSLHPLTLADVTDVPQRPKCEWHDEYVFVITRAPLQRSRGDIELEQISLFLGKGYVLTFQESHGARLQPVVDLIHAQLGPIRRAGADYLAYSILNTIVESYYRVLDDVGDYLDDLEDEAMADYAGPITLVKTNRIRSSLVHMRRVITPQREALRTLVRHESELVGTDVEVYLRDVFENSLQISELIESYRELAAGVNNTYLSAVSNRTNEVMKVLTIMASLFIPLTFIAGIYGMNFEYMPELKVPWGYPAVWVVMTTAAGAMLVYFYRRGWIGSRQGKQEDPEALD